MKTNGCLKICETCPWLIKNHRKKHSAKWYTVSNLRRLWNGIRTGNAPGMICHSVDPKNGNYGGKGNVKPGKEAECAGALLLVFQNMNAIAGGTEQPINPPLKKPAIAEFVWRKLTGKLPSVEDRREEVGVPW